MLASDVAINLDVLGVFMEDIIYEQCRQHYDCHNKEEWQWTVEHPCQPRASEARQARMWCWKEHNTQPQYWNEEQHPASCYATRQEKFPTKNRNL